MENSGLKYLITTTIKVVRHQITFIICEKASHVRSLELSYPFFSFFSASIEHTVIVVTTLYVNETCGVYLKPSKLHKYPSMA